MNRATEGRPKHSAVEDSDLVLGVRMKIALRMVKLGICCNEAGNSLKINF